MKTGDKNVILKMGTMRSSETLVTTHKATRRHYPDHHRHLHHPENLNYQKIKWISLGRHFFSYLQKE
jgi:hypothetical protein